jgi:hypothetical protein
MIVMDSVRRDRSTIAHLIAATLGAFVAAVMLSSCATATTPAPVERVGCWYSMNGGRRLFDYVLVVERTQDVVRFKLRRAMSAVVRSEEEQSAEIREAKSIEVIPAYCPDE